jgi:transposase
MNIKALGINIAKNIFELHGVDKNGKTILKKCVSRDKLPEMIAQIPVCLIGIEACGGSHYWARKFKAMGHDVRAFVGSVSCYIVLVIDYFYLYRKKVLTFLRY